MKVYQALIRSNERNSFRCGEWAAVVGIVLVKHSDLEMRVCYHVVFPDGINDYWFTQEKFEMRPVNHD